MKDRVPTENAAILISTRNRGEILRDSLLHLQDAGLGGAPLWIYDDASSDREEAGDACRDWPGATVIRGGTRVGQARGRNELLRRCNRTFALMIDDDQYFQDVGPLAEHLAAPSPPAVVAFQSVSTRDGGCAIAGPPRVGDAATFMGGACLFHVPSILGVGGYREFFVYGREEPELAMRLWLRGQRLRLDSRVTVLHNHRTVEDAARDYREFDFLQTRNAVLAYTMNVPLLPGFYLGLGRALSFGYHSGRFPGAVARGLVSGIVQTFVHAGDRTPVTLRQYRKWRKYQLSCVWRGSNER